jgi:hypothetical protein
LPWLDKEFGWTNKTAERYMSLASGKIDKFSNSGIPISGLYLLAAPSTPANPYVWRRADANCVIGYLDRPRRACTATKSAETMTNEIRLPHIYALLKASGHDAALAVEIVSDAQQKDAHARAWIKAVVAARRSPSFQISRTLH